ncbi:ParB/RepB/Spo0J family partition protein [Streptomyces sp. ODS05-4]|uniref:ParB/RepB/Spo0J family partition protein n=1 Tax=Streptomyces sp. ODS05-4 TaxID=2944939 RepID=UPI00210BAB36|nr:ParB/RepB/Spo0J family partition protein [Streptomyces sp. ODS05-4]
MSNKASKLGTGASFAHTQPVSARRRAIDAATNAPTEGAPVPVRLSVRTISLNPDNPRTALGDLSQLAGSLRDHGQKQAITVMSRFSYLEANPERADDLEEGAAYVVIDGNSRLAAAREAGLHEIKVTVDEELGGTPDEILESALVANIHRQDLDPLDEARALRQLLGVVGTQSALATRLHRSQGWVSQRLALLGLTPELQRKLVSGEESAELLRRVGNKKPEEQSTHLRRLKERKGAVGEPAPAPPAPGAPVPPAPGNGLAGLAQIRATEPVRGGGAVPEPRTAGEGDTAPGAGLPWSDGAAAMDIAFAKWREHGQCPAALARYIHLSGGAAAFAADLLAGTSEDFRAQLVKELS